MRGLRRNHNHRRGENLLGEQKLLLQTYLTTIPHHRKYYSADKRSLQSIMNKSDGKKPQRDELANNQNSLVVRKQQSMVAKSEKTYGNNLGFGSSHGLFTDDPVINTEHHMRTSANERQIGRSKVSHTVQLRKSIGSSASKQTPGRGRTMPGTTSMSPEATSRYHSKSRLPRTKIYSRSHNSHNLGTGSQVPHYDSWERGLTSISLKGGSATAFSTPQGEAALPLSLSRSAVKDYYSLHPSSSIQISGGNKRNEGSTLHSRASSNNYDTIPDLQIFKSFDHFDQGKEALEQRDYKKAIKLFTLSIKCFNKNLEAKFYRGIALLDSNRPDKAIKVYIYIYIYLGLHRSIEYKTKL